MLLEVKDLSIAYGGLKVLKSVTIHADRGERVAIIGPNGAGKSTLLKAIAGILKPLDGEILFEGRPVGGLTPQRLVDQSVVFIPQGKRVFPSLTVLENIEVMLRRFHRKERSEVIANVCSLFPILQERANTLAGRLSGGEQQVVALARALAMRPKLLLLDEPSHGLSPLWTEQIFGVIEKLREISIILVEQNVPRALALADRVYMLRTGRVVREGSSAQIADGIELDWGFTNKRLQVSFNDLRERK